MARRSSLKDQWPLDCTSDCCLGQHAKIILCCTALGNLQLLQHCASICGNPFKISDSLGRNALHVAASRGHLHIVEWLLARGKGGPIDVADRESKWTAFHRSVYFGHLGVAAHLVKSGASLNTEDFDGLNPLTLLNQDKRHLNTQQVLSSQNVYMWGTNSNVTLGHDRSKNYPERLELGTRHTITQMVLCKFHSVLLTAEGKVLTCGHGRGGRLGHGSEQSFVTPCEVGALAQVRCVGVAAARDHTAMLSDSGTVYTCGLNDAHQLGHGSNPSTAPQSCLAPKAVQVRALKNRHLTAVGVGRYHTAVCTTTEVYTFGKNLGQLGYERNYETQISPRAIPGVSLDEGDSITHLSVSDAATACLTRRHRIFVSADFIVRSIRCGFFEKTNCVLFSVCASLSDLDHLRKTETEPKKVLMLNSEHQLWYWEPMKKRSPNLLPGLARHKVTHFCLGKRLTIVTEQGEVYSGVASVQQPLQLSRVPMVQSAQAVFTDFKANNFAYLQNVYRSPVLPSLAHSSLSSDLTSLLEEACLPGSVSDLDIEVSGHVYATHKFLLASASPVLQYLVQPQQPGVNNSDNAVGIPECVKSHSESKLVLACDPNLFEALLHFIYGSHIRINPPTHNDYPPTHNDCPPTHNDYPPTHDDYPPKYTTASANTTLNSSTGLGPEATPDTSFASVDENDLTAFYDQYTAVGPGAREDPLELQDLPGNIGQSTPKKSGSRGGREKGEGRVVKNFASEGEPVWDLRPQSLRSELQTLQRLAGELGVKEMKDGLEELLTLSSLKHLHKPLTLVRPRPSLSYTPPYSDLTLVSSEGRGLSCHRCVLVARSDYFRSMLLMGWRESSGEGESLSLPVSYQILETIIHYMYTDEAPSVTDSDSAQWITSVLVVADQLLITRLKDLCEYALARSLTLRSVSEVLEFAVAYSAEQLKRACLQFICVNAASLLEGRYLDGLDSSVLVELSAVYREMVPAVTKRVIGFPDLDPSSLPESYFLGVRPEESPGSTSEGELPEGYAREDGELVRSPVSPRTPLSSGSRKKRKRKSIQGESSQKTRGSSYSPPTSPTELERTPKSGQKSSERLSACGSPEPDETPSGSRVLTHGARTSKPNPTPKGNPKRLMDRFGADRISPPPTMERPLVNGVCCNGHHRAEELPASTGESPPTAPKKVVRVPNGKLRSPPPSAPMAASKIGWSTLPVGSPQGSSLREIMAQEERSSRTQLKKSPPQSQLSSSPASSHSRTPPPSHSRTPPPSQSRTSPQTLPSRPHSKTPPQAVPGRRKSWHETRGDGIIPSPSLSTTPQSSPGNPWKTADMATSPTLSLRDLMAEAEKEERRRVHQGVGKATASPPSRQSSEDSSGKPEKRQPPVMVPHRQVSFADIIQSQEIERDDQRRASVGKPLSFIQIEEQVMDALKTLYVAQDNPDEYITVKRCRSRRSSLSRQLSQNSPWGRDIR